MKSRTEQIHKTPRMRSSLLRHPERRLPKSRDLNVRSCAVANRRQNRAPAEIFFDHPGADEIHRAGKIRAGFFKNAVHGDVSAFTPGGVRVGLSPLTSRSVKEKEAVQVAEFLHEAAQIALRIQSASGKLMKDFVSALGSNEEVVALRAKVQAFAHSLPMPGNSL